MTLEYFCPESSCEPTSSVVKLHELQGGASRNWQKQLFQILLPVGGDVKLLDREAGVDSEAPGPASAGASGGDDETWESEGDALEEEGS